MSEGDVVRIQKRVEKLQIMMADAEVEMIDTWRFENRAASRSAAVRSLILLGLRYADEHGVDARKILESDGRR